MIVAADAEHDVDDLLDAIEAGELLSTGDGIEPPDGALGTMFVAADKLAKDPLDVDARTTLIDLGGQIDLKHPPYGLGAAGVGQRRAWRHGDHRPHRGRQRVAEREPTSRR